MSSAFWLQRSAIDSRRSMMAFSWWKVLKSVSSEPCMHEAVFSGTPLAETGLKTLVLSSALAAALCYGYWKHREVDVRYKELQRNQQAIEQVRKEVRDLETRLEQTRARIKALENDPVEAEAAARRIGRTVRSKTETVFHLDESRLTLAVPAESAEPASKPAETGAPAAPAPPDSVPAPQQTAPPAKP